MAIAVLAGTCLAGQCLMQRVDLTPTITSLHNLGANAFAAPCISVQRLPCMFRDKNMCDTNIFPIYWVKHTKTAVVLIPIKLVTY